MLRDTPPEFGGRTSHDGRVGLAVEITDRGASTHHAVQLRRWLEGRLDGGALRRLCRLPRRRTLEGDLLGLDAATSAGVGPNREGEAERCAVREGRRRARHSNATGHHEFGAGRPRGTVVGLG